MHPYTNIVLLKGHIRSPLKEHTAKNRKGLDSTWIQFSIACVDEYTQETYFFNVLALGKLGEYIKERCRRNDYIFLTGKLTSKNVRGTVWTNVVATDVDILKYHRNKSTNELTELLDKEIDEIGEDNYTFE